MESRKGEKTVMEECTRRFFMTKEAPYREDKGLQDGWNIRQCSKCKKVYYALPTGAYQEVQAEAGEMRECLNGIEGRSESIR